MQNLGLENHDTITFNTTFFLSHHENNTLILPTQHGGARERGGGKALCDNVNNCCMEDQHLSKEKIIINNIYRILYQLQGPGHHTCTHSLESRVPAKSILLLH